MRSFRQALFALASINLLLAVAIFGFGIYHWTYEHGPVETSQILILLAAAGVFLRSAKGADGPIWTLNIVLCLLCLGAAAREFDPRGGVLSEDISVWFRGGIQGRIFGSLSAIAAVLLWVKRRQWLDMLRLVLIRRGLVFIGAGLVVLMGEILENWLKAYHEAGRAIEELIELNGMLLFLLAAVLLPIGAGEKRSAGKCEPDRSPPGTIPPIRETVGPPL